MPIVQLLLSVDASDPRRAGGAVAALSGVVDTAVAQTLEGPARFAARMPPPFE